MAESPDSSTWRVLLAPGSLSRRMLALAAAGLLPVLIGGGFALDHVLANGLTAAFDSRLDQYVAGLTGEARVGDDGRPQLSREPGDQRFAEPYSGLYWQITTPGFAPLRSRSLWDRALPVDLTHVRFREHRLTAELFEGETLRLVERDAVLPGSRKIFHFSVAADVLELNEQIAAYRRVLIWSILLLGVMLLGGAILLAAYGLSPLRRVRAGLNDIRRGQETRLGDDFPPEIQPLVDEVNALLDHSDAQAEQARTHAGNLAHALKTPMSVLLNDARGEGTPLAETVLREVTGMKRHVDHHLARARALGRRAHLGARAAVWPSLEGLQRALTRIYADRSVRIDLAGEKDFAYRGEKQDLDEMVGNVMDNACKYGAGRVRVCVETAPPQDGEAFLAITIEDNGPGLTEAQRARLFARGERLDQTQSGSGIGLAIVRDLAEICGGSVAVGRAELLGGLAVTLRLPAAGG